MCRKIREPLVKHDVCGKRQTAKMKLLPSLFSCVYSRLKLIVFAMYSRRRYSIFICFIYGLEEKNPKSEVIFAVCRLPLTSCLTSLFLKPRPNDRNMSTQHIATLLGATCCVRLATMLRCVATCWVLLAQV